MAFQRITKWYNVVDPLGDVVDRKLLLQNVQQSVNGKAGVSARVFETEGVCAVDIESGLTCLRVGKGDGEARQVLKSGGYVELHSLNEQSVSIGVLNTIGQVKAINDE